MIVTKGEKLMIEENIKGLLLEYGSLYLFQIAKYLGTDHATVKNKVEILARKGRLYFDKEKDSVMVRKDMFIDHDLRRCFWIIADLIETVEYHFRGSYPLQLMFFSQGRSYDVYYCPQGKEIETVYAIENQREKKKTNTIIVIDDLKQIQDIDLQHIVYCTINEKGKVTYYE